MTVAIFLAILTIALLGHGYFWVAIVNRVHGLAGPRKFIDGTTLLCLFAFLILPVVLMFNGVDLYAHWSADLGETVGFSVRYLQFCLLWCIGQGVLKVAAAKVRNDPRTLQALHRENVGDAFDNPVEWYHGMYPRLLARIPGNQSLQLCIERKRIVLPRLHESHRGLTIAQVSDFHMTGRLDRRWFENVVDEVNQLQPDVIAITGDIVEHESCLPWLETTLCRLKAKIGIYFILGNHDKFVDIAQTREVLEAVGQVCLSGRWLQDQWNGAPVVLAGNERPWLPEIGALDEAPVAWCKRTTPALFSNALA